VAVAASIVTAFRRRLLGGGGGDATWLSLGTQGGRLCAYGEGRKKTTTAAAAPAAARYVTFVSLTAAAFVFDIGQRSRIPRDTKKPRILTRSSMFYFNIIYLLIKGQKKA